MPYEKSSTLPRSVLFFSFLTGSLIGVTELYSSRHHVMRRRWSIPIPVTGHRYAIAHDVTKPDASSSSWRRSVLNVEAVFARRSYYTCLRTSSYLSMPNCSTSAQRKSLLWRVGLFLTLSKTNGLPFRPS